MDFDELVLKYRSQGILVDTNLLVLLAVGTYRRARIPNFNRTKQYTQEDFELLVKLTSLFRRRIVTPHLLAEADNLTRQLPRNEHRHVAAVLKAIVETSFEIYCSSANAAKHERFADLGLTDCTILDACQDMLLLTDDVRLSNIFGHMGRDAININHIRAFG